MQIKSSTIQENLETKGLTSVELQINGRETKRDMFIIIIFYLFIKFVYYPPCLEMTLDSL